MPFIQHFRHRQRPGKAGRNAVLCRDYERLGNQADCEDGGEGGRSFHFPDYLRFKALARLPVKLTEGVVPPRCHNRQRLPAHSLLAICSFAQIR